MEKAGIKGSDSEDPLQDPVVVISPLQAPQIYDLRPRGQRGHSHSLSSVKTSNFYSASA